MLVAGIFWGAALTFRDNGDLGQAVLYMDRSVKLYQKQQAWSLAAQAQDQLGLTLIRRKDYKLAEEVLLEALNLAETLNEPRTLAFININTAYLYQHCKEYNKALGYIETAIKIGRDLGDRLQLAQALATLADIKLALNEPEEAFVVYEEAIDIIGQTD